MDQAVGSEGARQFVPLAQIYELVEQYRGAGRGLRWNDVCLSFHKTERPVRTASATQVRQPIYRTAIGRWRVYEEFLDPLLTGLGPFV